MASKRVISLLFCLHQILCVSGRSLDIKDGMGPMEPDAYRTVPELITSKGYPCENHWTVTEDGYILNIVRIPPKDAHDRIAPIAFLQHGLLADSNNWVINHANQSLGFMLHDAGYDVWMGNSRGTFYSTNHTKLNPKEDDEYWKFSWDEMAAYDFPANLRYVLNVTKQENLYYIGHSQGTMQAFAALGRWPELQKMVKLFFALGPVTNFKYVDSPMKYLEPYAKQIGELWKNSHGRFLGLDPPTRELITELFCDSSNQSQTVCADAMLVIAGFDRPQLNATRIPVYVTHNPSGTSVQNMAHYVQAVKDGNFQRFDLGPDGNMKKYNQTTPPKWDASPIKTPVALFWGENDWIADPQDVKEFIIPVLPNITYGKDKPIPHWQHLDFIWALDAPALCYNPIIKLMDEHEGNAKTAELH